MRVDVCVCVRAREQAWMHVPISYAISEHLCLDMYTAVGYPLKNFWGPWFARLGQVSDIRPPNG